MNKKILLILAIFVMLSSMGAGCNCSSNNKSNTPITLTVWGVLDEESAYKQLNDTYQSINTNITINYVKKNYAEYEKETLNALAAGKGPDIWMIRNDWVYGDTDKLISMPKGILNKSTNDKRTDVQVYADMFPPIAVQDNIIDGKIYGIPLSIDTLVLYYNKSHFDEIQNKLYAENNSTDGNLFIYTPNNWEEFLKMSKILTQKNGSEIVRAGSAIGTSNNINNGTNLLAALMLQNNTQMTSSDQKTATFNLPITKETGESVYPGTQALNFYTSFSNPVKDSYTWNNAFTNSIEAFEQGKVSMIIDFGSLRNRLNQEAPTLDYDYGPLPQVPGATTSSDFASYWTYTVTNNSKNPNQAWNYISYLSQNSETYCSATGRPAAQKSNNILIPNTKERVSMGGDPLVYQQATAKYWFKGSDPTKVDNAFYDMITNVNSGMPDQTAIDQAASIVTKLYQLSLPSIITSPNPVITK